MNKDTLLKMIIDDVNNNDEIKSVNIKIVTLYNEEITISWEKKDVK